MSALPLVVAPIESMLTTSLRPDTDFETWRTGFRQVAADVVTEFVTSRCGEDIAATGVEILGDVLAQFIGGGKCLRPTFMYLGWLCGAQADETALRAAASLELVHAFALLQDDVMDDSALRRGRPSAHVQFARWHRDRGLSGSAARFGESAAVLLGDLCLIWAERMLRECGARPAVLDRVWPRYDAMRAELAAGQFSDLINSTSGSAVGLPAMDAVLDVERRKSGNYTVRRPLEIGAAMAGCDERTLWLLGRYGTAVGEAFQLRDDVEGVFGSPVVTGKPVNDDLRGKKITPVIVAAQHMADATVRRQLIEFGSADQLDDADLERWRALIVATGAVDRIEDMITDRTAAARELVYRIRIGEPMQAALVNMASICAAGTA